MVGITDIGLAVLVLLSLLAGFKNGFIESLFSLAAWLGGILLGVHLAEVTLAHLPGIVHRIPGAVYLVGVLLFLIAYAVLRLLGAALGARSGKEPGTGDRWLGGLFGLARGLFLSAAVACFLVAFLPPDGTIMQKSRALPLLAPAGRFVAGMAPSGLRQKMDDGWARIETQDRAEPKGAIPA
jgi:membrane protein required for colicin V production